MGSERHFSSSRRINLESITLSTLKRPGADVNVERRHKSVKKRGDAVALSPSWSSVVWTAAARLLKFHVAGRKGLSFGDL